MRKDLDISKKIPIFATENKNDKKLKKMASRGKRLQKKMKGCAVVAFPSFKTQDGRQFYQIHKK